MIRVNGRSIDTINVLDRGLMYGDGVFRTMLVRNGTPLQWRRHYLKLQADCGALGISCPSETVLADEVDEVSRLQPDCVLKILVTRGEGKRGYAVSADTPPTWILVTSPVPSYPDDYYTAGVRMHVCAIRLAEQPRLAGIKHLNRLENVLARREWDDPGVAEGLLLDSAGNVIEGTMTNLFMVRESGLWTPDLSRCGVAGVQRDRIMEVAGMLGIPVRIAEFSLARLLEAEEVFLCNSVAGIWRVRELSGRTWRPGYVTAAIRQALENDSNV